jgi:hypothetical protein
MTRCLNCKKKCSMPITCVFCCKDFCIYCRYLEVHKCEKIDTSITKSICKLEKELNESKVTDFKNICKE